MVKNSPIVKVRIKHRFFRWFSGPIILSVFAVGVGFLWRVSTENVAIDSIGFWGPTIMFLIVPWFLVIYLIVLCWPVVTLDNTGIRVSLFRILKKEKSLGGSCLKFACCPY
jgi:hypothetical protein